jgi:hypothetical protein
VPSLTPTLAPTLAAYGAPALPHVKAVFFCAAVSMVAWFVGRLPHLTRVACAAFRRSELAAGGFRTCGVVKEVDSARCWGRNGDGESTVPAVSGGWASLTGGRVHTCGILKADDAARCWGYNGNGQTTVPAVSGGWASLTAGYTRAAS